jgi:tryptophan synthase alpha chain
MLQQHILNAKQDKGLALMTHMVLGYPSFDDNWAMLESMEKVGADVVELQFPFSEPIADGPVFVAANQASLDAGTTMDQCFEFMKKASERFSMPLLMMGYYNTAYAMGETAFLEKLKACGGKGTIIPDLPLEYAHAFLAEAKRLELEVVQIITPNSSLERKKEVAQASNGFVYCVARKGVTGKKTSFDENLDDYLDEVKSACPLPIALGFGVKSHDDIRALVGKVDMAIIGTAGLQAWVDGGAKALEELLSWRDLKARDVTRT